jgi:hypothetical protein
MTNNNLDFSRWNDGTSASGTTQVYRAWCSLKAGCPWFETWIAHLSYIKAFWPFKLALLSGCFSALRASGWYSEWG